MASHRRTRRCYTSTVRQCSAVPPERHEIYIIQVVKHVLVLFASWDTLRSTATSTWPSGVQNHEQSQKTGGFGANPLYLRNSQTYYRVADISKTSGDPPGLKPCDNTGKLPQKDPIELTQMLLVHSGTSRDPSQDHKISRGKWTMMDAFCCGTLLELFKASEHF